jgi:hypothetical protein
VTIDPEADRIRITLPYRLRRTGGRVRVADSTGRGLARRVELDDTLIAALKAAHGYLAARTNGQIGVLDSVCFDVAPNWAV